MYLEILGLLRIFAATSAILEPSHNPAWSDRSFPIFPLVRTLRERLYFRGAMA
ncbi:hypothetical protein [Nostoc sp. PA-18-2419]|uniref:hypothetical protein n=1 Tax=Nostoc sp. PA-18-2419 TaxID=2575443 RepID=UPI001672CE9C|nr:hypothetical protein [Nostoc sp. PA-18-2419]